MMLGGLVLGIAGCITALIARRRNKEEGDDQKIRKTPTIGLNLSILSVTVVLILFAFSLIFRTNTPTPDISTPVPSTPIP